METRTSSEILPDDLLEQLHIVDQTLFEDGINHPDFPQRLQRRAAVVHDVRALLARSPDLFSSLHLLELADSFTLAQRLSDELRTSRHLLAGELRRLHQEEDMHRRFREVLPSQQETLRLDC